MEIPIKGARVTMKDIAARAGVSVTAVSMALRDNPRLLPETRERIKTTARELGYTPNPMVSALMSQVAKGRVVNQGVVVGLLVDPRCFSPTSNAGDDDYLKIILNGLTGRLKELGCSFEQFVLSDSPRKQRRINKILSARGITGVLLPSVYEVGDMPEIDFHNTTVVTSGYSLRNLPIHRVVPDEFQAMRMALGRVRARGYKRPALFTHSRIDERVDGLSIAAFLSECMRSFPQVSDKPLIVCDPSWEKVSLEKLIERHHPDVIVSNFDRVGDWLVELGYRVPEDVGFLRLGHRGKPRQVHTDLNGAAIGSWMVDLLTASLNRNEIGMPPLPKRLVVPPRLVEGDTLRPPPEEVSSGDLGE